jgi:dimeric dUTPase (all-alpha-NTP-PPase superfamily)
METTGKKCFYGNEECLVEQSCNECDFYNIHNNPSNPLKTMFDKQKILQGRLYGVELPKMMPEKLTMQVTAIVAELGEILEEQQAWKDWKKNPKPVNKENLDTEISDVWHFIINLSLYLGYDADDILRCFLKKNQTNHERQDTGY